jgi:hypothetical protein
MSECMKWATELMVVESRFAAFDRDEIKIESWPASGCQPAPTAGR